jgi:predicted DNA-binding transcriptional regulator AlpA
MNNMSAVSYQKRRDGAAEGKTNIMNNNNASPTLPAEGYARLPQVLAAIPVSRSSWYAGVKAGKYPQSVKLGPRTTAWKVSDIRAFIAAA